MKTIVITGPSCSGKTYLSNKLSKLFHNSIVINTDSYYKDSLFIKFLSIFLDDIYDRIISCKIIDINKTIRYVIIILNKLIYHRRYNQYKQSYLCQRI